MSTNPMAVRQTDRNTHRQMLVQNLGIFELRALGREVGVHSPTTKKRDELIELILDNIYSNEAPTPRPNRKGRPYKKLSNLDDIMSQVTGTDSIDNALVKSRPLRYEDIVFFAQEVPVYTEVIEKVGIFKGIIRISAAVAYFIDYQSDSMVFLAKDDMFNFGLMEGDFVEVKAKKINSKNQYTLSEILSVNFVPLDKYEPRNAQGNAIISTEALPYGDFKLFAGRRNLIEYKNNLFEDGRFAKFAQFCQENDYKLITLGLNTSFEDQIMFSGISNMVNLTTPFGTGYDDGFNRIVDAIALTKRLLEIGEKCVLFVSDIVGMFNILDMCFPDDKNSAGHKEKTIVIAQKLISLGRALSDGSSATIIMTYNEIDKLDIYLHSEVKKISSLYR